MAKERLPGNSSAPETAQKYRLRTIEDLAKEGLIAGSRPIIRASTDLSLENLAAHLDTNSEHGLRLFSLKPTIDLLIDKYGAIPMIIGHNDRPEANGNNEFWPHRPQYYDPELSLARLVRPLSKILGRKVVFKEDFDDGVVGQAGEVVLYENLRFWPGETKNDPEFARKLAGLGNVYINNDFPTSHRNHASITGITEFLPHAAGLHLEQEIEKLSTMLSEPQRPFVAVVGGAKLDTKLPIIKKLAEVADRVLVGGLLPTQMNSQDYDTQKVKIARLSPDGNDISGLSAQEFRSIISSARTVFWNGPLGNTLEDFDNGSSVVAQAIADNSGLTIVAGGDTIAFLAKGRGLSGFTHVSTGGGAGLEFVGNGGKLPGIDALLKAA